MSTLTSSSSMVCAVDASGIHCPPYAQVLEILKQRTRDIYGPDVYLEPDSQDGQWLGVFASAIDDANRMAVAVYNAFSPATAQGAGLSRSVRINGLRRGLSSHGTVTLHLIGQPNTEILLGVVRDAASNLWDLPESVVIGPLGEASATATARTAGEIRAAPHSITEITTPTFGWQSATNPEAALPGCKGESDADLRRRQACSTALPSRTVLEGVAGAIAALPGVGRLRAYENDTNVPDAHGLPPHSIALVVEGCDLQAIAATIATKKTPGTGTYGSLQVEVQDSCGVPNTIRFFAPRPVPVRVEVEVRDLGGYLSSTASALQDALAEAIESIGIGNDVVMTKLYVPANLPKDTRGATFEITALRLARDQAPLAAANLTLAFDERPTCTAADIDVRVVA